MTLEQYLAKRRYWEVALILLVSMISFGTLLSTELIELGRFGSSSGSTEPLVLEATNTPRVGVPSGVRARCDH